MRESREALLIAPHIGYADAVARTIAAGEESPQPVQAGIEAVVAMAEDDPEGTRAALWQLQTDWEMLQQLEQRVGGEPAQAALRIGAAIQLARAELSSPAPQLRRRMPELLEFLAGPS
jgi:hypothetical protein